MMKREFGEKKDDLRRTANEIHTHRIPISIHPPILQPEGILSPRYFINDQSTNPAGFLEYSHHHPSPIPFLPPHRPLKPYNILSTTPSHPQSPRNKHAHLILTSSASFLPTFPPTSHLTIPTRVRNRLHHPPTRPSILHTNVSPPPPHIIHHMAYKRARNFSPWTHGRN